MKLIQNGFGNNFGLVGKNLRRYLTTTALTATSLAAFASPAFADNWTDHVASEGTITIDTSVPDTTNITQGTDFVKVNGDGDINAGWTVNIAQPSSSSKYVLYDIENDPTEIMGALNANGRVYIFDQNGVIFGAGSQVNVGSIIASTGNISDANIKSDKHVFENVGGQGSIQLKGTVSVADAGLAAFVAPGVSNSGVINAKMGTVALASGNQVTLDLYGDGLVSVAVDGALENALVENSGQINANGGNVVLAAQAAKSAVDSVINMSGIVDVSSSSKGGKVSLSGGNKGVVTVDGSINANGGTGGGTVTVTGENILASDGSIISADAVTAGDGGSVVLIADKGLIFTGSASARGGALSGKGGFVDTSGLDWIDVGGSVDVSAFSGLHGTWLIDPSNLEISTSSNTNVTGATPFAPTGTTGSSRLNAGTLNAALNTGANVLVTTVGSPNRTTIFGTPHSGTIIINADITKSSGVESTLTLEAAGGIILNAGKTISATAGNVLNVTMKALGFNLLLPTVAGIQIDGAIKTNGGDVDLHATVANIQIGSTGYIETAGGYIKTRADVLLPTALGGTPLTGGTIVDGYVDAQGGNIDMLQSGVLKAKAESIRTSVAGTINLSQSNLLGLGGKIQNAIDAIKNTGTGTNTVNVGVGEYKESVKADVNNLVLKGAWAGINPLLRVLNPDLIETVIKPNSPGFVVTADNVVVDGFVITGATGADGYGVHVNGGDNAVVKNNVIKTNTSHGVYVNNGAQNTTVNSNRIYDLGGAVVDSANGIFAEGVSGLDISGNFIDDVKGNGIYVKLAGGLINVKGNFIGQGSTSAGVDGIWGDGIEIHDVNGNTFVQSNVISNTWDPTKNNTNDNSSGVYLRQSSNIVVGGPGLLDGNLITDVDWDGIKMAGGTGNRAEGNIISDVTRIGIYGEGTNNATITKNSVSNANLDFAGAITLRDGDDHTISYNFVTGPTSGADAGIMLHAGAGGNNVIHGNIVHDINGIGIDVFDVSDVDITLNSVSKTKGDGIYLHNAFGDLNVVGNIINDIKGNGIYVKLVGGLINVKANLIGLLASDAETNGIWGDGIEIHDVNGNTYVQSNVITNTWDPTKNNTNDNSSGVYLRQSSNIVVGGPGLLDGNLIYNVDWDGVKMGGGTGHLVQGNVIHDTTRIGIYGEGTNNATVDRNIVSNANLDLAGAITLRDGDDHTISFNVVTGPTSGADAGIMLHAGAGGNNLIVGNIVHDIKGTGIEVFDASDADIKFNSVTKTQGDGIFVHNAYGDFNIIANEVDNTRGNGIYVKLVGGLINVKANLIGLFSSDPAVDGIWGDGIEIHDVNGNTFVQSNIISNTWDPTKDNTNDNSSGIYLKRSSNIVVGGPNLLDGNIITNADWDGVKMSGGTGNLVQGNAISHSTRIGIYGEGTNDATVVDNLVYDSNLDGKGGITLFGGGSHYVNNNVVWNNASSTGHHGIYLALNTGDNEISDNWVYDVSHDGIRVEQTTGTMEIDNNKIGTVDNGIWAKNVQGLVITDNLIDGKFLESGKGTFGIYVEDSDYAKIGGGLLSDTNYVEDFKTGIRVVESAFVEVLGNIVNQFVDNGIHATNTYSIDIKKNVVGLGDGNGILVENSDDSQINENGVALVGGNGIHLVDSDYVDIIGNIVALTGGYGIYVDPSNFVDIGNNWVHFTGDDGIRVDLGVAADIYGNHVGFTLGDGIEVNKNDNAEITNNIVHHTLDNGILVYDTNKTTISGNTVYRTGKNGIFTNFVNEVDVTGNTVKKAGWDGIHVAFFGDAFIGGNTVSKSGDDGIEAHDGHIVEIDGNTISKSGWGNWWSESYDEFLGGHDGISVRNIHGAYVEGEGEGEEEGDYSILKVESVYQPGSVRITNNGVGADEPDDEIEVDDEIVEDQSENAKFASFYGDDNGVSRSGDDGIEVVNVEGFAYIAGNSVEHSGVGSFGIPYGQADSYGADGIHVRDVYLQDFYGLNPHAREGDIGNGEYNIVVSDNDVNNSLDDGIEVLGTTRSRYSERVSLLDCYDDCSEEELPEYGDHTDGTYGEYEGQYEAYGNTQRVLVSQNTVSNSGWGAPSQGYGQSDNWYSGGDGIHVENVYAYGYAVGASEENVFSGYAVDILGNVIDQSGDDGIDVEYASSTLIDDNTVTNSGWVGEGDGEGEIFAKIEGYESGADYYGADGIFVNNVGGSYYGTPSLLEVEGPGDGYQEYSVVIRRNDVDNSLDDGIQVNNNLYGYGDDSKVSVYSVYGYTAPVLVGGNYEGDGNNVTDSGFHGLYISGPGHNNVIVSGNAFANFDTGAQFESGLIDLTGATNTFDNGRIGLRFSPYQLGSYYPEDESEESIPYFAYLDLVDDDAPGSTPHPTTPTNFGGTIGKQVFTGFKEEGDFYVYLDPYALTNDGTPIWLNGLNSTYDGITPSDTDGALSQEDYDFLEARFQHFPDDETTDIFWFGFVADDLADINQSLIFNKFNNFRGDVTGLNVRILGLPSTGTAGPGPSGAAFNNIQTFAGGTNPADLNEIETAAGGNTPTNPADLNEVEAEAGGENENCWSAAANAAGAGTAVNVVYGGSFDDNLDQAAACGTSF